MYRSKGYQTVSVDIPEQNVDKGVVYLQVVEGKIARLRVKDASYFSLEQIKAGVPELAEGNVPNLPVMQQQLNTLASQSPDRKITPVLRAGESPGTLEVDLKVKDNLPLHGKVELNGRNTASTSLLRLVSSVHYDNLWQKMHSASLMYQVAPENSDQVDVWAGTYALPLFNTSTRLALYAVSSSSNTAANAGSIIVLGAGDIYGVRLVKPLPSLGDYSHNLTVGADHKFFRENLSSAKALTQGIITPISYTPFMAQYGGSIKHKEALTAFNVGVTFSVRGVGNSQSEFENKRYNAQANYSIFKADLSHTQELPLGMQFFGRMNGQVADSPIISNEQLSIGGMQSVRGYYETQALVDRGVIASMELRSPHLAPLSMESIDKLQALAFIDGGSGWILDPIPGKGAKTSYNLASAGVGMRFRMLKYLSGALDVGFPMLSLQTIQSGDPKFHFNVATEF